VTFHNAENGFCVLRAKNANDPTIRMKARGHRELVTVIGHAAIISAGEWITASADDIEKYLSSGMIRGVGPAYAKKLVRAFGEKVFDVIEATPDRLREVDGIGPVRAASILAAGPNRRRFGRSWFSCTAMASARRGRCGFSRPMVPTPSRS
jgi:exodeoxyribonuclease V alpha subunit